MPLFKSCCTGPKCVIPGVMQVQYSLFPSAIFPTSFCRLTLSAIYCATILHSNRVAFEQRSCQMFHRCGGWVDPVFTIPSLYGKPLAYYSLQTSYYSVHFTIHSNQSEMDARGQQTGDGKSQFLTAIVNREGSVGPLN